ncbi:serine hydroxymethyltransferase [Candidatus Babeliales bacterium]|nr:serine hydroxymethyltransferase [Candidatus Babeliales bacterium]
MNNSQALKHYDAAIALSIEREEERIESTINLIASENYTSDKVMAATSSVMTNKYAEGYPSRRYYGGCQNVDTAENIARERLLELYGLSSEEFHANVQAHSGSQANMAVYFTFLELGDTVLGMDLAAGGHLTHGYKINFSGTFYSPVSYGVHAKTEELDYEEIKALALQHKPKMIIAGASAYSKIIDFKKFREIADEVGAILFVDMAHIAGLVATGQHPSPFLYADVVTSTTHKTLRGPRGGIIICKKEWGTKIDRSIMPGLQGGPLMHHIAAKAVAFKEAMEPSFKEYQTQVIKNAQTMVTEFKKRGYRIVSNGTDNHLFVVDLRSKKITGKIAEQVLESVGISLNKNCIPNDPEKPMITSGIRIGTPAITTRGFKEEQVKQVVDLIDRTLMNKEDEIVLTKITHEITQLCNAFPVYKGKKEFFINPATRTESETIL